jgi:hypothetical protein
MSAGWLSGICGLSGSRPVCRVIRRIVSAGQADPQQIATSLRVTSLVAVKQSMLAGQPVQQAMSNAFVQSLRCRYPPRAGWWPGDGRPVDARRPACDPVPRVTSANPCKFCSMLAGRGAVYLTAETAGENNRFHDHCSCVIAPEYA